MTSFGKYQVLECIGAGGFGRVFRGYDPLLKRKVAIKTCTLREPSMRERFVREAEIAANLRHPNIVTVYDFGEHEGEPYIVQEYLEGEDLDHKIERPDVLDLSTVADWLRQIADGLLFAHGRGVVHRDVKAGNLRVLPDGQIRIMDFGIAKLLQSKQQLTQSGASLGTIGYLAPEQLLGQDIDHRVDIFSFGVVAYELVARRRPFEGETITEVMFRIAHEDPPPLREMAPTCSPRLIALIEKCLQKAPQDRFASFLPIMDELNALTRELGGVAATEALTGPGTEQSQPSPPSPAPKLPKRRLSPSAWGFIAAAFAVAVLGVINLFRVGHSTTTTETAERRPPVDTATRPAVDSSIRDTTLERVGTTTDTVVEDSTVLPDSFKRADRGDTTKRADRGDTTKESTRNAGSPAPPPVSPNRVVLLVRSELRIASEAAEAMLSEELRKAGYQVVDGASALGGIDESGLANRSANAITRIGQANEAGTVLLIDASADARQFTEGMFSGTAAVDVRVYPTSTGRLETSKRFEIGTAQTPGELGPTESAAETAAVKAASYGAARFLTTVLSQLR